MHTTPVSLQTKFGYELYKVINRQYQEAKQTSSKALEEYRQTLWCERSQTERRILGFLNDPKHKMDPEDGDEWAFWKENSDKFTILNHFYERRVPQ